MNINRDNYEAWFLDFLDGNLNGNRVGEFREFLRQNPDLQEELQEYDPVYLETVGFSFPHKETLYREPLDQEEYFDQVAVAWMEGDLEPAEALRFEEYLQRHPGKQKDADLFRLTRLAPDQRIVFPRKAALYHQPAIRLMMTWTMRVAAVLLVAALTYSAYEIFKVVPDPGTEVAETRSETPESTKEPGKIEIPGNRAESGQASSGLPGNSTRKSPENRLMADNRSGTSITSRSYRTSLLPASTGTQMASSTTEIIREREAIPASIPLKEVALEAANAPVILALVAPATTSPQPAKEPLLADTKTGYRPLNEVLMEKTGLDDLRKRVDNLSISKLTRFGLRVAATVSNKKFRVDTNKEGEIIAYNLDTRLLGLSIPVKKD